MARVYLGRLWSVAAGQALVTEQKGTIQWVSSVGGFILPETVEDVPEADLDMGGCYVRAASRPQLELPGFP